MVLILFTLISENIRWANKCQKLVIFDVYVVVLYKHLLCLTTNNVFLQLLWMLLWDKKNLGWKLYFFEKCSPFFRFAVKNRQKSTFFFQRRLTMYFFKIRSCDWKVRKSLPKILFWIRIVFDNFMKGISKIDWVRNAKNKQFSLQFCVDRLLAC